MEKQPSSKNRKSAKRPLIKEEGPFFPREAETGLLVRLTETGDCVVVASRSQNGEGIEDISLKTSETALDLIIDRATEVIGDRKEAMRWLGTPIRGLDFATSISRVATVEGQMRVNDILGQMEHGIW